MQTWLLVALLSAAVLVGIGAMALIENSTDGITDSLVEAVAGVPEEPSLVDTAAHDEVEPVLPAEAVGVEELMRNPEQYSGSVRVRGVISAVAPSDQSLALIDLSEYEECAVTTCAELTLPVRWPGAAPDVGQVVELVGEIRGEDGKLIFAASALQIIEVERAD